MKQNQTFTLIDGKFSVEEAEDILTMLFNYKIDYHNKEDFSNHIRFNTVLSHSKKRIVELTEARDQMKKMLENLKPEFSQLIIQSSIKISFENSPCK